MNATGEIILCVICLCVAKALQTVIHIKHKHSQSRIKHDYAFFNALNNKDKEFQ